MSTKPVHKSFRRLRQVGGTRRAYLLRAAAYLFQSRVVFAFVPTQKIFDEMVERRGISCRSMWRARRTVNPELVAWSIYAAARHVPWRSDCLIQAMAAAKWLRSYGHEPSFELGVWQADQGNLRAHAWLSLDGRILVGGEGIDIGSLGSFAGQPIMNRGSSRH